MIKMYNISPVYARFVLRDLLRRGIEIEPLFSDTSLNREQLETGGNIAMGDFVTLLNNAREITGDEQLGLMIGRHCNIATLGPVGAAAAIAPTVREGLQVMANFSRLHASYVKLELSSNMHGLSVRIRYLENLGQSEIFHTESSVMLLQHYVEMMTGWILDDAEIRLRYDPPGYADEYAGSFHSPVSFGHTHHSIEIASKWLDLPSPYFNAEIWEQAQLVLAQRIRALGGEEKDTYTQHLTALMRSCEPPLPDVDAVAARLQLSTRTLNRRLREEGSSYRAIKGETLKVWARQHLTETSRTVEAIAAALGYQDTANFRRAFHTWEGCSPHEFRRRLAQ